ncbi:ATP-binding protein [Luteolibacter sp. LG18]|uniref:sensor histidine kinase n=1 Tax=Luteolibacter sp. LG18 TaxID=2819286 RepID=UPI002B2AC1A4|nr:hypothetical protein llg_39630 [Luteolibacter sp. LG18]
MASHSIRWRLQAWLAFFLILLLTGFGFSVYHLERGNRLRRFDAELENRVSLLSVSVRGGPNGPGGPRDRLGQPPVRPGDSPLGPADLDSLVPPPESGDLTPPEPPGPRVIRIPAVTEALFADNGAESYYYQIWRAGRKANLSVTASGEIPRPENTSRETTVRFRERAGMREAFHFTERGDCVLVGRSLASENAAMSRFALMISLAGLGVLVVGIAGGWWLTGQAIRPIAEINEAARRISAGNLSNRIPVIGDNELSELATVLNSTFGRLEEAFERQRQFTADASHELRTPLTLMISEAQTTLARERSPEDYQEALAGCLDAAQQMRRLTEALLDLARSDGGPASSLATFDMAVCAHEVADRLRPLVAERQLVLELDLATAAIHGSPERFGLVVGNLLSNAVHYNRPGGVIRVRTRQAGDVSELIVEDTGVGIAEGDLPRVFDRFYRADRARSRADGRFGLGLAICRAVVEADGGTIGVTSRVGMGSTFTVSYPAKSAP